jgi:ABC-type multidrug transport system ATPase subunit
MKGNRKAERRFSCLSWSRTITKATGRSSRSVSLLERFELSFKRHALAGELSRGMRQKVAICCGYLHRPRAVLLDELLTGLDPLGIRTRYGSIAS